MLAAAAPAAVRVHRPVHRRGRVRLRRPAVVPWRRLYRRDAWLDRPQGLLLTYRALLWLNDTGWTIRVGVMLAGAIITVALGVIGWLLVNRFVGVVAAFIYAIVGVAPHLEGMTLNGELLASVPVDHRRSRWPSLVAPIPAVAGCCSLAGVFAGLAITMKQSGIDGIVVGLVIVVLAFTWSRLLIFVAGFAVPLIACVIHGIDDRLVLLLDGTGRLPVLRDGRLRVEFQHPLARLHGLRRPGRLGPAADRRDRRSSAGASSTPAAAGCLASGCSPGSSASTSAAPTGRTTTCSRCRRWFCWSLRDLRRSVGHLAPGAASRLVASADADLDGRAGPDVAGGAGEPDPVRRPGRS